MLLSDFWTRFQSGIEVAVASSEPDKLLGVRDGFLRYFHDGLERPVPVAVVAQPVAHDSSFLPLSDEGILSQARGRVCRLREELGTLYSFYACAEAGLHSLDVDGSLRYFVRNWTVIWGPAGEACGGSGSVQLPTPLIEGIGAESIPYAVPGTRRRGGMVSSLTGGLETRRKAVALSTLHALSSLLYGVLESRPLRPARV